MNQFCGRLSRILDNKRVMILIFVVALLIGGAGYVKYAHIPMELDALMFKQLGEEVAAGSWITSPDFGSIRTPGYPLIIGTIYTIFGNNDLYIKLIQIVIFAMNAVLIFYIGHLIFNKFVGILATFWYITYYDFIMYSYLLMREIWTLFFILLTLLFFIQYLKRHKLEQIILGSLSFGYLIMIDPRYGFFGFVLVGFGFFFSNRWAIRIRDVIVIIAGILAFLVPWVVRQSYVYDRFILFSPKRDASIFAVFGKPDQSKKGKYYPFDMKRDDYIAVLEQTGLSSAKKEEFRKLLTDDYIQELRSKIPQGTVNKCIHRFFDYWRLAQFKIDVGVGRDVRMRFPWDLPKNLNNIVHIGLLLPFFLLGVYLILKKHQLPQLYMFSFFFYHMLFHVVVHYMYRYRYPVLPIFFLIGWCGVYSVLRNAFKKKRYFVATQDE